MKINAMTATSLLVLAMSAPVTTAFAQAPIAPTADTEMQALSAAKIAAAEAVATVEKASGGKVVELSLDLEGTTPGYRVSVVASDGVETTYLVDAETGAAIMVFEDHSDRDPENNQEGEDGEENDGGDEGNSAEVDAAD